MVSAKIENPQKFGGIRYIAIVLIYQTIVLILIVIIFLPFR